MAGEAVHLARSQDFGLEELEAKHLTALELVVLRGRSGSGKSTVLNVAGLLARPDTGSIDAPGRT
ncbi:ATP-binding cassette domain-containing protein [Amycolatopsis sp. NPDC051071]|uniref:ATP-binding cassette domain-containing protein n=1 Tax=Amycolatopsis sp. NPDC051071 TaxID=3154637 RepID=UPI003437C029